MRRCTTSPPLLRVIQLMRTQSRFASPIFKHTPALTPVAGPPDHLQPVFSPQVASNCSTIFVDGSESGLGSTCAKVEFVLGTLRGSVCLEVWAPSVPLQVALSDPVLNAIHGWSHLTDEG